MRFFKPSVVRRQLQIQIYPIDISREDSSLSLPMNMISPPAVEHVIRVQTGKRLNGYILIIADNILIVKYKKVIFVLLNHKLVIYN